MKRKTSKVVSKKAYYSYQLSLLFLGGCGKSALVSFSWVCAGCLLEALSNCNRICPRLQTPCSVVMKKAGWRSYDDCFNEHVTGNRPLRHTIRSVQRWLNVGKVVRNAQRVLSFNWPQRLSCQGREWKIFYCQSSHESATPLSGTSSIGPLTFSYSATWLCVM